MIVVLGAFAARRSHLLHASCDAVQLHTIPVYPSVYGMCLWKLLVHAKVALHELVPLCKFVYSLLFATYPETAK